MAQLWLRTSERAAERACLCLSMAPNASVEPASDSCAADVREAPLFHACVSCLCSVCRRRGPQIS